MIRTADDRAIDDAAELLRRGQLVAIPTETVYGLGANAWDETAVQRIFAAKGRPPTNPLIVHVASFDRIHLAMADPVAAAVTERLEMIQHFWPGPLTVIVPRSERIPDIVTAGLPTVGIRVPDHDTARALLERCDFPVAAPSANRTNYVSPTRAEHVEQDLGEQVALILDGGPCTAGVESTIVSLVEDPPRILRVGALSAEQLAAAMGVPIEVLLRTTKRVEPTAQRPYDSPGQSPEHYAPRTPLALIDELGDRTLPNRVGWIRFRRVAGSVAAGDPVITLSETGDLAEISQGLFAALRQLDEQQLDLIVVDTCNETGMGRAIMDRLRRARGR